MHMDSSPPANLSGDREKILQELIQGRESANKLLTLILGKPSGSGDDKSSSVSADDLLMKIFSSFAESISVLNRGAPLEQGFDKIPVNTVGNLPIGLQPEDSEGSSKSTSVLKQRRGCYKRRYWLSLFFLSVWSNYHGLLFFSWAWGYFGLLKSDSECFSCHPPLDPSQNVNKKENFVREDNSVPICSKELQPDLVWSLWSLKVSWNYVFLLTKWFWLQKDYPNMDKNHPKFDRRWPCVEKVWTESYPQCQTSKVWFFYSCSIDFSSSQK